jgi:hypothetical protein
MNSNNKKFTKERWHLYYTLQTFFQFLCLLELVILF